MMRNYDRLLSWKMTVITIINDVGWVNQMRNNKAIY